VFTLAMWQFVSTAFDGIVMAKLPFTPLGFFHKMTHAGVGGNDFTEAGGTFVYILAMLTCRQVLVQLLGQQPSRAAVRAITAAGTPAWADTKKVK
jgi:calcium load-activated calcium channel